MSWIHRKSTLVVASSLAFAAILGGSLGLAAARQRDPLSQGFNLVGGPLNGDVAPATFASCLGTSWNSIYTWDANAQQWHHYIRSAPAYVNSPSVGGIQVIPRLSGVVLIMDQPVSAPNLLDSNSDTCS